MAHGKGIARPAGARRDHIDVGDRRDLRRLLTGKVSPTDVALVLARLVSEPAGDTEDLVERGTNLGAKGSAGCAFDASDTEGWATSASMSRMTSSHTSSM